MIDTISLLIPRDKMTFFSGSSNWELNSKTEQYEKFVRNPNKSEKVTGKYFPRLTGYTRKFSKEKNVRIEFSAPKLLYLNNLEELEETDFNKLIEVLQERLRAMDVIISKAILESACVSSVHFSKNILLQNGYTSNHIISEINKIDLRKSFDFAKTRFINDGQSLYAHTTTHQLVIYDKVADLDKDKKRAIDKDQTPCQRNLFSKISNTRQEIIRFEARISQKQKLNKLLEELGYHKNPTFKEIFKTEISKRVITDYWERVIKERSLGLFSISPSDKDVLQSLLLKNSNLKPKQAIYLFGLLKLAKSENGIRQLRAITSKRSKDRTWYRIAKDIEQANELATEGILQDWVIQIDKAFAYYKPYKISEK